MKKILISLLAVISLFSCGGSDGPDRPPDSVRLQVQVSSGQGRVTPDDVLIAKGSNTTFSIQPAEGFVLSNIFGCGGGALGYSDGVYSVENVNADCEVFVDFIDKSGVAQLDLSVEPVKTFLFDWSLTAHAIHYRIMEGDEGARELSDFYQIGEDIPEDINFYEHIFPLITKQNYKYILQTCFIGGCLESSMTPIVSVEELSEAASFSGIALPKLEDRGPRAKTIINNDGSMLFIAASLYDRPVIDGIIENAGAVFVYHYIDNEWELFQTLQSNTVSESGGFGAGLSLSGDGNTLAIGSPGLQRVELYAFENSRWVFKQFVDDEYRAFGDDFGSSIALNHEGTLMAVGSPGNNNTFARILSSGRDNLQLVGDLDFEYPDGSGAVIIYELDSNTAWEQKTYIKNSQATGSFGKNIVLDKNGENFIITANAKGADNTSGLFFPYAKDGNDWRQLQPFTSSKQVTADQLGNSDMNLSGDGNIFIVSAQNASGINNSEFLDSAGLVFVFKRNSDQWTEDEIIFPGNASAYDNFGAALSVSKDGNYLAIGAFGEDSDLLGIHYDVPSVDNDNAEGSGAVYIYKNNRGVWDRISFIKPKDETFSLFGSFVSFSEDGGTLIVGSVERVDDESTFLISTY